MSAGLHGNRLFSHVHKHRTRRKAIRVRCSVRWWDTPSGAGITFSRQDQNELWWAKWVPDLWGWAARKVDKAKSGKRRTYREERNRELRYCAVGRAFSIMYVKYLSGLHDKRSTVSSAVAVVARTYDCLVS